MLLVIDSSVVVQGCQATVGFQPLGRHELVAPPLLWSEAESVLHELAWRRTITRELASQAFERLLVAPIDHRAPAALRREAWQVADQLGWSKTYDAEYVALASLLGCPLLTLDARLRRGGARVATIIGPAELPVDGE